VTPADLAELAAASMPGERLGADELTHVCCGDGDVVIGDERGAVTATTREIGGHRVAWITFIAVQPAYRRRGLGAALVERACTWGRDQGARELQVGNAAPRYLWPGVDMHATPALALFEATGFARTGVELNMRIATTFRAPAPPGIVVEGGDGRSLVARAYPHWVDEVERAIDLGTCVVARADGDVVAVGCHSVVRRGWIGPMATDPARQRSGAGRAVLAEVCADLARRGEPVGDIAWVGPVRFYAKCGARVSRAFATMTRRL
jgi:GNAT superfamily N-acetyltransferase